MVLLERYAFLGTELLKLVKQIEQGDRFARPSFPDHPEVDRMSALEDRCEMAADLSNLVVAYVGVEDLGQDRELAFARELFVVQIRGVDDDGVACGYVDVFANLGLDGVLQLKYTSQWNVGKGFYKRLSRPWPVVTTGRRWE